MNKQEYSSMIKYVKSTKFKKGNNQMRFRVIARELMIGDKSYKTKKKIVEEDYPDVELPRIGK